MWDVAWHGNNLFVTETVTHNGRVFVYDGTLELVKTLKVGYGGNGGIAVTDMYIFVTLAGDNIVYRIRTADGGNKKAFDTKSFGTGDRIASNRSHVALLDNFFSYVFIFDTYFTGCIDYRVLCGYNINDESVRAYSKF